MPKEGKNNLETTGLRILAEANAWPQTSPAVSANDGGWFNQGHRTFLSRYISGDVKVIVELGSWMGKSARWFCHHFPQATVICIDHWQGSAEHHRKPEYRKHLPTLYETFLKTNWPFREQIIPVRLPTLGGMACVAAAKIQADLVYVDAAHDPEEAVRADIMGAIKYWPDAIIVGDDWPHEPVQAAVRNVAESQGRTIRQRDRCWQLVKG